jgi:hypothetical protein
MAGNCEMGGGNHSWLEDGDAYVLGPILTRLDGG